MNFIEDLAESQDIIDPAPEDLSKKKWKKLSNLILKNEKKAFRKTLLCINSRLYLEVKKSVSRRPNSYISFEEFSNLANKNACKSKIEPEPRSARPSRAVRAKAFQNNSICRGSAMTLMIGEFRDKNEN